MLILLNNIRRAAERHAVLGEIERMKIDKERIGGDMGWMCACGCGQRGHDLHHALISRLKHMEEWIENLPAKLDKKRIDFID